MPDLIVKIKSFASLDKNKRGEISVKDFFAEQLKNQDNVDLPANPKEAAKVREAYAVYFEKQVEVIGELCSLINTTKDLKITAEEIEAFDKKYGYDLAHSDQVVFASTVAKWDHDADAAKAAKAHHRRQGS